MLDSVIVEQSLKKARWVMPDADIDAATALVREHDIPEIVARMLIARGVEAGNVSAFLNPTFKDNFPDPFSMAGMEDMADYAAAAIAEGKNFAIFGDFDVDGATSSAVMHRFLKACGIDAPVTIPERLTEGYGPNVDALKTIRDAGADILFMLDCGTTANEIIAAGRDLGLEVIILDHHEAGEELPSPYVINPKRKDDSSGLDMLAAVGVTFMTCVAINNKLRRAGFYEGRSEPKLKELLDLVALGTVCDMVPLTGVNRLLVKAGFAKTHNVGISALADVAGVSPPFSPYHAGFVLGPRINAGSRVNKSRLGAELLCTDDAEEARNIAWTLNDNNDKRKAIQAQMEQVAVRRVEDQGLDQNSVIIVDDESFHPGLSGLVAGQIKEKYKMPACVITYAELPDGTFEGRGSGRSVAGVHIAKAFMDAVEVGILLKGGGHAMAGGFSIDPSNLDAFKAFMQEHVKQQLAGGGIFAETQIDGVMSVQGISPNFVQMLEREIGPFGQAFPEPLFMLRNVRVHFADVVGVNHLRLQVSDWEGGARIKVMAFRGADSEMGRALLKQTKAPFHLIGHLKINEWQGRISAEMHLRDAAFATDVEQQKAL